MLFALLLGMAMNFLSGEGRARPASRSPDARCCASASRCSGLRITAGQVVELGLATAGDRDAVGDSDDQACRWCWPACWGSRACSGCSACGATAICGASAAMALRRGVAQRPRSKERATLFTVIGVSVLSTLTMIIYPMLATSIGLDPRLAGVSLGATIHDVAQVVGAGYGMSQQTGDVATLVKLMRVAMLLSGDRVCGRPRASARRQHMAKPAGRAAAAADVRGGLRGAGGDQQHRLVARRRGEAGSEFSRWCLVAAIAGIGMKTQLKELVTVGIKPVVRDARGDHVPGGTGAGADALGAMTVNKRTEGDFNGSSGRTTTSPTCWSNVGDDFVLSKPVALDQARIDDFAERTGDRHGSRRCRPSRRKESRSATHCSWAADAVADPAVSTSSASIRRRQQLAELRLRQGALPGAGAGWQRDRDARRDRRGRTKGPGRFLVRTKNTAIRPARPRNRCWWRVAGDGDGMKTARTSLSSRPQAGRKSPPRPRRQELAAQAAATACRSSSAPAP